VESLKVEGLTYAGFRDEGMVNFTPKEKREKCTEPKKKSERLAKNGKGERWHGAVGKMPPNRGVGWWKDPLGKENRGIRLEKRGAFRKN